MLITADATYIREVHRGLSLYRKGLLGHTIASGLMWFIVLGTLLLHSGFAQYRSMIVFNGVALVAKLCMLRGLWRYTTLEGEQADLERPGSARRIARISLVITGATSFIMMLFEIATHSFGPPLGQGSTITASRATPTWMMTLFILNSIAWVVMFFSTLRYSTWMFGRVPSLRDQILCERYMWLLPLIYFFGMCFLYIGPIISGILLWHLLGRLQRYLKDLDDAIALAS